MERRYLALPVLVLVIIVMAVYALTIAFSIYGNQGQLIPLSSTTGPPKSPSPPSGLTGAIITNIIDGDTIDLDSGERVRLLGINTPESGEILFEESSKRLEALVMNKSVLLEIDKTNSGIYTRLLRHIYVLGPDGSYINAGFLIVLEGLANTYFVEPDILYKEIFHQAEEYAINNELGLWKPSNYSVCIDILNFVYDSEGDDRENLNGEYITLKNNCNYPIQTNNWTLKDEATHIFRFPQSTIPASGTITIHTGKGDNTDNSLYWGMTTPIWNNNGDTVLIWDENGNLVFRELYG